MHPVSRFLSDLFESRDRRAIARELKARLEAAGYRPSTAPLYRLIDDGQSTAELTRMIAEALGPEHGRGFTEALELPMKNRQPPPPPAPPWLWVLNERRVPSPIFVVGLTGVAFWKVLPLPGRISQVSLERQRRIVARRATRHFTRRTRESFDGGPFGPIIGYVYVPTPSSCYFVDTRGRLDGMNLGPFNYPNVGARVGVR